jgi:SAM-dependent methyltransferase
VTVAGWFEELLGVPVPVEGGRLTLAGRDLLVRHGVLRDTTVVDQRQEQTNNVFGFKWGQRDTYSSAPVRETTRRWLVARYGDWSTPRLWERFQDAPVVLDAGCGAAMTASLLFGNMLERLRYVGADVSTAVDIAAETFGRRGWNGVFLQSDLMNLPLPQRAFDFILAEGVLHHTRSTREALLTLCRHLKPGGIFAFYVYARKAPAREFTDDLIRERLAGLSPDEAWRAVLPLTRLGKALGKLKVTIEVPEEIALLGIPAGSIDIQRLFYWFFCKMYYRPEYSLDEMNHVNFDWFAPAYCHRQTPEEVNGWCAEAGLTIEAMQTEPSGITVIAVRET